MVLKSRKTISAALVAISVEGGPDLDIPTLADQAQVSEECLQELDAGSLRAIDLKDLESLCSILGRSPNDLLGYEADE